MINDLKRAVEEWYFYQKGTSGGFQTALFDAIQRADALNLEKLAEGFPFQVQAFKLWQQAPDNGKALFREYGLNS